MRHIANVFLLLLTCLLAGVSCKDNSQKLEVETAFGELKRAVLENRVEVIQEKAPFLLAHSREGALQKLKDLLVTNPSHRVIVIDPRTARVEWVDYPAIVFLFKKDPQKGWVLSETVSRAQFIEFLPAKPAR